MHPSLKPARRQRKPKDKLTPALAHELDIHRAASMGIDISYMAPGQRCKYPSKFCCDVRAVKSTGSLHRFCEFHRSRAKVNQMRWVELRRRHETVGGTLTQDTATGRRDEASRRRRVETPVTQASCSSLGSNQFSCPMPITVGYSTKAADLSDHELDVLLTVLSDGEHLTKPAFASNDLPVSTALWDAELTRMALSLFRD